MSSSSDQRRTIRETARDIPIRAEVDVVVCGGGSSGVVAAIAAARQGARTVLIEHQGFLGGVTTAMGVNGVGGWQHDWDGRPLIAGIPLEIMQALAAIEGGADAAWVGRLAQPFGTGEGLRLGLNCYWIQSNPEWMKLVLDRLVAAAGVRLLLHADAVLPIMDGERVAGVSIESKSGREAVLAPVVIDCTGDGDIAARAGAEVAIGRAGDGACQPMTTIFTVGGFDRALHIQQQKEDPQAADRFRPAIAAARARGEIRLNPNDVFCAQTAVDGRYPSVVSSNVTRIQGLSAIDVEELTRAEQLGREQVAEIIAFARRDMVGFRNAFLCGMPAKIGLRESRRILGDHVLTGEEVKQGARFADAIARGIYTLDIHNPTGVGEPSHLEALDGPYDIPYRCLLPRGLEGLLVAGRCISGDAIALSSYRIQSHCMAMGQAAGTAAALAARDGILPRRLDPIRLRAALLAAGAHIDPGPKVLDHRKLVRGMKIRA